jgi:hypothetical protein
MGANPREDGSLILDSAGNIGVGQGEKVEYFSRPPQVRVGAAIRCLSFGRSTAFYVDCS